MSKAWPDIDARRTHLVDRFLHFGQDARLEKQCRNAACNLHPDFAPGQQFLKSFQIGRSVHPHEGVDDDLVTGRRITIHHVEQRGKFRIAGE